MCARLVGVVLIVMALCAGVALALPKLPIGGEDVIAEAQAAADKYEIDKAVALYTKAIESGQLSPPELAGAYMGRALARQNYEVAYGLRDSELVLSLRDFRKARELMPTDYAFLGEAYALSLLGAYSEAASSYRDARAVESPTPHWSLIGLARVERIQGRYDAALAYLNEALRLEGVGTMPIHYHRGRTLYLQEKFGAAAEAFTNGLQFQADYAYAHLFRGCANARAGETSKALADIERALELASAPRDENWDKTPAAKSAQEDMARDHRVIKAMAAGGASEAERATLCKFTWNSGETRRERSPLLTTDDMQIALAPLSHPKPAPSARPGRVCKAGCDKP